MLLFRPAEEQQSSQGTYQAESPLKRVVISCNEESVCSHPAVPPAMSARSVFPLSRFPLYRNMDPSHFYSQFSVNPNVHFGPAIPPNLQSQFPLPVPLHNSQQQSVTITVPPRTVMYTNEPSDHKILTSLRNIASGSYENQLIQRADNGYALVCRRHPNVMITLLLDSTLVLESYQEHEEGRITVAPFNRQHSTLLTSLATASPSTTQSFLPGGGYGSIPAASSRANLNNSGAPIRQRTKINTSPYHIDTPRISKRATNRFRNESTRQTSQPAAPSESFINFSSNTYAAASGSEMQSSNQSSVDTHRFVGKKHFNFVDTSSTFPTSANRPVGSSSSSNNNSSSNFNFSFINATGNDLRLPTRQEISADNFRYTSIVTRQEVEGNQFVKMPDMVYPLMGNKRNFMNTVPYYGKAFNAALNHRNFQRVVDAFAGSAVLSCYISKLGKLTPGSIVNENNPFRNLTLWQIQQNPNGVKAALDQHRQQITRAFKLAFFKLHHNHDQNLSEAELAHANAAASLGEVADVMDTQSKQNMLNTAIENFYNKTPLSSLTFNLNNNMVFNAVLKQYFHDQLPSAWPIDQAEPNNSASAAALYLLMQHNTFRSGEVVSFYVGASGRTLHNGVTNQMIECQSKLTAGTALLTIDQVIGNICNKVDATHEHLQHVRICKQDGWDQVKKAGKGDFVIIDPTYVVAPNGPAPVLYNAGTGLREETTIDQLMERIKSSLLPAWNNGAHIIMTNRYSDELSRKLGDLGMHVVGPIKPSSRSSSLVHDPVEELIAVNFDASNGNLYRCEA
jgi:hypothetical protein